MAASKAVDTISEGQLTLADINNIDQALEFASAGGEVVSAAEMGDTDGFRFVRDKSRLVGSRFVVVDVDKFTSVKFGDPIDGIVVKFVSAGGYKGKFVDFGTGIKEQVYEIMSRQPELSGILCDNGLVRSEYDTEIDGKKYHGVTYYLDTAPAETGHIV